MVSVKIVGEKIVFNKNTKKVKKYKNTKKVKKYKNTKKEILIVLNQG